MSEMPIHIQEMAGLGTRRPLTGGVPIAEGAAPEGTGFALHDQDGQPVPLQTSVLSRWADGSARWVLLDFQSAPEPKAGLVYSLSTGQSAPAQAQDAVRCTRTPDGPVVTSGRTRVSLVEDALLNVSDRVDVDLVLTDADGEVCKAVVQAAVIETEGPLRSTLALVGSFHTSDGRRVFEWRLRASVYAGLSRVRLEPLILVDADQDVVQHIRALALVFRPRGKASGFRLGGQSDWEGALETGEQVRVLQVDDQHCRLEGVHDAGGERKSPGWAEVDACGGTIAVALRDFWQQWPKSLEATSESLSIGLFPHFEGGAYDHMEPWYKYQYLFDGNCYRLRTGQARRWDAWLDLGGDGASLARAANAPLIPVAEPAEAVATGVWDAIVPAGTPETEDYDRWAANLFGDYMHSIEDLRDYGAMNWGDWFGERQVNWGNHEYDTTNQILIQFARTGDPRYFYAADAAARHSSEVDTVHHVNDDLADYFRQWQPAGYPPRPGMVHQHAVGHVGGFYPVEQISELFIEHGIGHPEHPYLCLDPFNLGHVWTQGMVRHYFLTGDPFLKETVQRIADNLAKLVSDRVYRFMGHTHCGRTTGWPLLALGGAYEIDRDERYLEAMRTLADDALEMQDPVCGGWLVYPMAWDHCPCKTQRHTGMAGFITAVLINGLSRYYDLSGDERLREAVDMGVTFLDNDTWREEWRDWRYTSCPATKATDQPGVVMMAHVNGARIAGRPTLPKLQHLRILSVAWKEKFARLSASALLPRPGMGKSYTSTMYGCAETVGLLASTDVDELL